MGRPSVALGLRSRIVGVVLVTTVATLAVAALALLGPLDKSLRRAEQTTLRRDLGRHTVAAFAKLDLTAINTSPAALQALVNQRQQLASRVGATVNVLADPAANGTGSHPLLQRDTDDPYDDVAIAFRTRHSKYSFGTIAGREYARAA